MDDIQDSSETKPEYSFELDDDVPDESLDQSDEAILETALARFALAEEAEADMRKQALDDLEFLSGKQWSLEVARERELDRRPCLIVNRLPQQVQQVTNDQRQNRPAIKVSPIDSAATEEVSDIIEGIVRHIEYNSSAETAYDTAGESAVRGGFGYWRILTDFVDPESFDQEIFIKRIRDVFSVRLDPYAQEPDGSDTNWGFITEDLAPEEYKAKYPGTKLSLASDWNGLGSNAPGWIKADSCRVAEYFYKEMRPATIHLLATGETVHDADLASRQAAAQASKLDARVLKTRQTKIPVVKWCTLTGLEILEKTTWVGTFIPIIPVYGNELFFNGKRIVEGIVRHAKDPQRMLNYMKSAAAETIGLAPRTPWVVAEGQLEGYTQIWEEANRKNHAYLPYKPTSIAGAQVPLPQRQTFEPAVQAVTQSAQSASEDIDSTTGVYPSARGEESNEISGVGIQARASQTQISNFHFFDNLKRSIRHTGRCLVEIIPKVYDSARAQRILKDDGTQKIIQLNQQHTDPDTGKSVLYSLSAGTYDVTVDTGPSYATKRQEAAESMVEFSRALPQTGQFIADLIARNMDWPGSQEMADRLKKLLPPQLQDDPQTQQIPPQAQQQINAQKQMIMQLSQHLDEKTKIIEQKQIEVNTKKMVLEHDERIELAKIRADLEIALAKEGGQSNRHLLTQQVAELMHRDKLLGAFQPIGADDPFLNQQDPASQPGGAMGAMPGQGAPPTGGQSPGQSPGANP